MYAKLSVLAALSLAPWAQSLLLQIPVDWQSSTTVNISWANSAGDSEFALQLVNTDEFHDTFSIANNLQPSADFTSFELGVIPAGSYTLRAISPTNSSDIFDQTPSFSIAAAPSSSASSSASSTASASSASASGSASSGSGTLTVPASSNTGSGTTTGFGVTVSASSTPTSAGSGTATAGSSGASTSQTAASSNFNGAASLPSIAPMAFAALGVVAGAAFLL